MINVLNSFRYDGCRTRTLTRSISQHGCSSNAKNLEDGSCSRLIGNEYTIRCCDCGNWFHRICAKMTIKELKKWTNSNWHCGCENHVGATTNEGHDATGSQPDVERCGDDIAKSRCQLLVGKAPGLAASVAPPSLRWPLGAEP